MFQVHVVHVVFPFDAQGVGCGYARSTVTSVGQMLASTCRKHFALVVVMLHARDTLACCGTDLLSQAPLSPGAVVRREPDSVRTQGPGPAVRDTHLVHAAYVTGHVSSQHSCGSGIGDRE